jgi:hypothetical protein
MDRGASGRVVMGARAGASRSASRTDVTFSRGRTETNRSECVDDVNPSVDFVAACI